MITRNALDTLTDSIVVFDLQGRFLLWNKAVSAITGYNDSEISEMHPVDFFSTYEAPAVSNAIARTLREGHAVLEASVVTKDGKELPFEFRGDLMKDPSGRPLGICVVGRDITQRKRAENALAKSEARYRSLVEAAPDPIVVYDHQGLVTYLNPAFTAVFGWTLQEGQETNLDAFVPQENASETREAIDRFMRGETAISLETKRRTKDGRILHVQISASVFKGPDGKPAGSIVIHRNVTEQKVMERELRKSKEEFRNLYYQSRSTSELYRALLDASPDPIVVYDIKGIPLYLNPAFTRLFGWTFEEVRGKRIEFVPPEDWPETKKHIDKVLRGEDFADFETRRYTKDGRVVDVSLSGAIFFDEEGTAAGSVIQLRDITERKRAELALRESEDRYRTLFEQSRDAIAITTPDGRLIDVNQSFSDLFGYDESEILTQNATQFWADPLERSLWQEEMEREGFVRDYPWKARTKVGQLRDCLITATIRRIQDGSVQYQTICRDITQQKRAAEALQESEDRYRLLTQNSLTGIYIHQEGLFVYVNQRLEEILGYSREEIIGKKFWEFVHPQDRELVKGRGLARSRGERVIPHYEFRVVCKDGTTKWLDVLATTINFRGRKANMGNVADITDRRRLEGQLRQAMKMEAIGRLAGGVAHDFNNFLTAIIGYSNILLGQMPRDDANREKVVQISRAADAAADLTRQLLAFSRKQVLRVKVLDINERVTDLERILRRLIGEDINLITVLNAESSHVRADPGQVEQIMMNLAVNARDAMPDGGNLIIETANVLVDEEYTETHPDVQTGPYVMLGVSDSGKGMDAETRSRIFDPFFTTKPKGMGTGLGLSTVYGIVKQHEGHIQVYSEPGRGTTFKVYLPCVEESARPTPKVVARQEAPRGTETVLIVEDEQIVLELACEVLEMLGYRTLGAANPAEALAICSSYDGTIDLLLTDVVLPEMDGRSLYSDLSSLRPRLKVLYMSGYTPNAIVHHGVLESGLCFLQKPFTTERLARKVREVLDASLDRSRSRGSPS